MCFQTSSLWFSPLFDTIKRLSWWRWRILVFFGTAPSHFFPLSQCPSSSFSLSHCWDESTSHDYPQPSSFFFLSSHPPLDYPLHAHMAPSESISLHFILHCPTHPGVLRTLWCKRCSKNGWLALFCISCCWLCWSWCVTLLKHRLW